MEKEMSRELLALIKKSSEKFVPECAKFVHIDRHMNRVKEGTEIKKERVEEVMNAFLEGLGPHLRSTGALGVLQSMTERAKEFCPSFKSRDDVSDAIVVEFINRTGMDHGIDYAMYTKDLA